MARIARETAGFGPWPGPETGGPPAAARRRPIRRSFVRWAGIGLLLAAGGAPAAAKASVELKQWVDGPIRYISMKEESKAFRSLNDDSERAVYIERFWRRRDPSAETLANEYRQLFWERVQYANAMFLDSSKPGWKTDRGKIYILYGPPTEIQQDPHLQTDGLPNAGAGVIRWIYEGRPGQRMDLNPIVVVPFVRETSGEYKVSYDPELASVFFDAHAIREDRDKAMDRYLSMISPPTRSQLSVMLDLGRMQEVPPQEQVLLERVETSETYDVHPVEVQITRYERPEEPANATVVTVDLSDMADTRPAIIARFTLHDATERPRLLGETSFRIVSDADERLAQGRLQLDPGTYDVTVVVADPENGRTAINRGSVSIAGTTDEMRLSDVVFAAQLESLDYASLVSYDEPFIVGPFRVVPRLDSRFQRGDSVKLFFEVYDATYPMQVSYQLQGLEEDGSWIELGRPASAEQHGTAQAWALPTSPNWPTGDYRIRIEVQGADGRTLETFAPFTLVTREP
jgi:GWxTD domain-containing protein